MKYAPNSNSRLINGCNNNGRCFCYWTHDRVWSSLAWPDPQLWDEENTVENDIHNHHILQTDLAVACWKDTNPGMPMRDLLSVSRMLLLSSAMFHKNFSGILALPQARKDCRLWSSAASVILFLPLTQSSPT